MSRIVDAHDYVNLLTDGALADYNALVSKRTGGSSGTPETKRIHKVWRVAGAAQTATQAAAMNSLWQHEGFPCHGATPTTWANPTNATDGSLRQADPGGGRKKWLEMFLAVAQGQGVLTIYDRLGHMGGLSGTTTTAQNVNGGSPGASTRYTTGERVELWFEIYTAVGATATTITASYSNQAGAAKTSQPVVIGSAGFNEAGRVIVASLASGDYGVRDVTSVTVLASTLTAGNFGVTLARPLVSLAFANSNYCWASYWGNGSIPEAKTGACLAMLWHTPTVAASPIFEGITHYVEA